MPRSNWKGIISFSLISIPISLFPMENKSADIHFHQIDKRDNAKIKLRRINSKTGKEVPWNEITKGYEYDKGMIIPVPKETLKKVAGKNFRNIHLESFIEMDELDLLTIQNVYYLIPDNLGKKGYVILREALNESKKIGIAKIIISTKEQVAALMSYKKALIVCILKYAHEIKPPEMFDLPLESLNFYHISKKEVTMAKQLIKSMIKKWHPKKYIDHYQQAIYSWVEETANQVPHAPIKQQAHTPTDVTNFIALLKKSLAASSKTAHPVKHHQKTHLDIKHKSKPSKHVVKH